MSPRVLSDSSGPSKAASSYQPSLFNLRFGPTRSTRPGKRVHDDSSHSNEKNEDLLNKRRRGEASTKQSEDDIPLRTSGTTTNVENLFPVTRESFTKAYQVDGLDDVYYQKDWIDAKTAHRWHTELEELTEWYRPKLKVYGREIQQSRSIAAFATSPGLELKYSGHQVEMHAPFPSILEDIATRLSSDDCLGESVKFNHAMLNHYQDGQVYIGRHSDNMENKVIVTVSLGAPRTWVMEEKKPRGSAEKGRRHKWVLENGSLLVMQGSVQKDFTHEIPKEPKVKESRISITFRQMRY